MRISVVIPTITGRERWLAKCEAAYRQTTPDVELVVVKDQPSCGIAWAKGAALASGGYVHFTADDITPFAGWWEPAVKVADAGGIPLANVFNAKGEPNGCQVPLGELGVFPNVLVPFFSRELLEQGDWCAPIHYGSDDWITYLAVRRGVPLVPAAGYSFTHHVATEGRAGKARGRAADVAVLVAKMQAHGYLPPAYGRLSPVYGRDARTRHGLTQNARVTNISDRIVTRAGMVFHPGTETAVALHGSKLREVRACVHLRAT